MGIDQMIGFFKWMTVINVAIFLFSVIAIISLKNVMGKMHGVLFGLKEEKIPQIQYAWLGIYKILIIVFNIIPLIALSIVK